MTIKKHNVIGLFIITLTALASWGGYGLDLYAAGNDANAALEADASSLRRAEVSHLTERQRLTSQSASLCSNCLHWARRIAKKGVATSSYYSGIGQALSGVLYMRDGENVDSHRSTLNSITTVDHKELEIIWDEVDPDRATVIYFHGNGMTSRDAVYFTNYYKQKNLNTLAITVRGYPGSQGSAVRDKEEGLFYDVEAAVSYLIKIKRIPRDRILVHGLSLGSAYAMTAGLYFNLPVILERPFASLGGVGVSALAQLSPSLSYLTPRWFSEGLFEGHYEVGRTVEAQGLYQEFGHNTLVTDGLNNLSKAGQMKNPLFIIQADQDEIMGSQAGEEIFTARYGTQPSQSLRNDRFLTIKGSHNSPRFFSNADVRAKLDQFLSELKFDE